MQFKTFLETEEEDYLKSKEFGKGLAHHLSGQNINVDGSVEIDWRESEYVRGQKKIVALYKIYDIDNKIVKSGAINYYSFPSGIVPWIVYENAKKLGIYHPSNLLLTDGEFNGGGIAQPNFDEKTKSWIKQNWNLVKDYLI